MALMDGMFDWLLTPPEKKPGGETRGPGAFVPAHLSEPPGLTILICNFDGSRGSELAERLVGFLSRRPDVVIKQLKKTLKLTGSGGLVEKYLTAAETGRKWLTGTEADVLIWGDVSEDEEDAGINMRVLCATADADKQPGSVGIGDTIELPYEFPEEMEELVFAAAVAAVGPRRTKLRGKLTEMLKESVDKLNAYVDAPPTGLEPNRQSSVMTCLGNILASLWRLNDDGAVLDRSIKSYRAGLTESFDRSRPMPWALAQNHLAAALEAQAGRDNSLKPLLAAADCYRGVAAALGSQLHTNDWALAHIHLGDVLVKLADHGERIAHLKEASNTYQKALLVFTRQTMPGPWSELLNQIGVTMMTIGENVAGTQALEQSAACFRQALEVRRREVAPLLWAQTANNLGAVTFALYRRESNVALLNEAAACFEGAAEVYSQHGRTNTTDVTMKNLDRVKEAMASADG